MLFGCFAWLCRAAAGWSDGRTAARRVELGRRASAFGLRLAGRRRASAGASRGAKARAARRAGAEAKCHQAQRCSLRRREQKARRKRPLSERLQGQRGLGGIENQLGRWMWRWPCLLRPCVCGGVLPGRKGMRPTARRRRLSRAPPLLTSFHSFSS